MIQEASLDEELFLVLLLKGDVLKYSKKFQGIIAKHFNLYDDGIYPELHITLDRIKKHRLNDASKVIEEVLKETKFAYINVELDKFVCFRNEEKFLVLKIKETPSLINLSNCLHNALSEKGISVIHDYQEWAFHITILSNIFVQNPITDFDFESLCFFLEGKENGCQSASNRLEIWSPILDPTKKCLASFQIK